MQLQIKKLSTTARLPEYAHPGDAGLDLFSDQAREIAPGESVLIKTGIAMALPPGTEGQVRPRSGLAAKHGITVLNSPGTIDEGYRGEICVMLVNHGKMPFAVGHGMKIAQLVVAPVTRANVVEVEELCGTTRGEGGFGSTGLTSRHA